MQCKDIPDVPVLEFLGGLPVIGTACGETIRARATWFDIQPRSPDGMPTVVDAMPPLPSDKLALAKMRQLIRRGLVDGCACGCRGDFELTDKGREYLATQAKEHP